MFTLIGENIELLICLMAFIESNFHEKVKKRNTNGLNPQDAILWFS